MQWIQLILMGAGIFFLLFVFVVTNIQIPGQM